MHDSGGANAVGFDMLMISAVAIFFSWSDATDLSDLRRSTAHRFGPSNFKLQFLRPGFRLRRLSRWTG
jgi:hypothetical protein